MFLNTILSLFCFVTISVLLNSLCAAKLLQERAVIKHCNPKYFSYCTAITKRVRRGQPYTTNMTAELLQPFYNNVTLTLICDTKALPNVWKLQAKLCDALKKNWVKQFLAEYSNVPPVCPFKGVVSIFNIELPPKDFPLPILKGDRTLRLSATMTDTKELMIEGHIILHNN